MNLSEGRSFSDIWTLVYAALRVPNSTLTVTLLRETGPLAITSANPSGACDCTHHNKVDSKIAAKIDYILADGSSRKLLLSSVAHPMTSTLANSISSHLLFYLYSHDNRIECCGRA